MWSSLHFSSFVAESSKARKKTVLAYRGKFHLGKCGVEIATLRVDVRDDSCCRMSVAAELTYEQVVLTQFRIEGVDLVFFFGCGETGNYMPSPDLYDRLGILRMSPGIDLPSCTLYARGTSAKTEQFGTPSSAGLQRRSFTSPPSGLVLCRLIVTIFRSCQGILLTIDLSTTGPWLCVFVYVLFVLVPSRAGACPRLRTAWLSCKWRRSPSWRPRWQRRSRRCTCSRLCPSRSSCRAYSSSCSCNCNFAELSLPPLSAAQAVDGPGA